MPSPPLLDREFLEKLERLTIHWQKSFPGLVGGHNKSRFPGAGQEFLDHRNFHHGDDLRAVNWRAFLRLEKLFLKMFQVEPRVPVRMLIDQSESMSAYNGAKFDYARKLAGALCYVGLVRLDSIEIHGFASRLTQRIFCTGGRHRFSTVSDGLSAMQSQGQTDYLSMVREFCGAYSQRGLVIVISDFLDDRGCEKALQYLADFGHELMLLQVWADEDRTPPWVGELELRDAETGRTLKLDFDAAARERYTRAFDEFSSGIQTIALRSGGRYAGVSCSQPLESVIFGELIKVRGIA
ncbi:MAG TPA: DUF58 domain-containing protein [Candidatus Limnocylindrales bacterium]|jgi:uncharacterized protein (DUF58 family)|nr:DUF58 domain-containing protein [Candidatus Limnocylindrales bacterium]